MIEILPETEGNTLVIKATEMLTAEDYETVFIPAMDELIQSHGKVHVALLLGETFEGWEIGAMWDDARFGIQHRNDFEKIAVIGGPNWVEWTAKLGAYFMEGHLQTFDEAEFSEAISWLKA